MAARRWRTAWINPFMALVIVAMNIWQPPRRPGDAIVWFAILALGFLFVAGAALLMVNARRRRN